MIEKPKEQKNTLKIVTFALLGALLVYTLTMYFTNQRFENLESQTRLLISEQETILTSIAQITARNGADAVTESIVRDCSVSERSSFDTLLGNLNSGLNRTQLVELERLFGRCGSFYSERKSVMVARLVREIEIYDTYVNQLSAITNADESDSYKLQQWKQLSTEEQKLSMLFAQLVQKQDEIISSLLAGNSAQSEEIQAILYSVNEIQETLVVTNSQVAKLRAELVSF